MKDESMFTDEGNALRVRLRGEIDHHTAKPVREAIDERVFLGRPHMLILDFSGVPFMDSSGLSLILGRAEVMEQIGGALRLVGLSTRLRHLVHLCGVEKLPHLTIG